MGILSGTGFHSRIGEPPALSHGRYDGAGGLLLWYDMMVLVWMTVSRFVCAVNGGVREQRKTEGQSNGLTLRQRDSERNGSGSSPELIGSGAQKSGVASTMDRVSRELAYGEPKTGYPLAAQLPQKAN